VRAISRGELTPSWAIVGGERRERVKSGTGVSLNGESWGLLCLGGGGGM
jgi:hypothetical protein